MEYPDCFGDMQYRLTELFEEAEAAVQLDDEELYEQERQLKIQCAECGAFEPCSRISLVAAVGELNHNLVGMEEFEEEDYRT